MDHENDACCTERGNSLSRVKRERRRKNWKRNFIVTAGCLVTTIVLGCMMSNNDRLTFMDYAVGPCFYLSVLLNAGWCCYFFAPFLARDRLYNALLFMGLFVWGCMLYFSSPVIESSDESDLYGKKDKIERLIEAPNRTAAAFFPSRGGFEAIAKSNEKQTRLHYFVFQTAVLFYVALVMFAIFGRGVINRVHLWLTPWHGLNVFWGRSEAGMLLARSIVETTVSDQVFFMLQQKSGDGDEWRTLTRDIDDMKGMWSFTYDSNAVETDVSKDKLAQAKGRRHFFMDESGHINVSRADRLVKVLKRWKRMREHKSKIRCLFAAFKAGVFKWWLTGCKAKPYFYVRVEAPADELIYQRWAANVRDVVTPVLIREPQLISNNFIGNHPLLKMPGIKLDTDKALVAEGEFNILILGFGDVGQAILSDFVCNSQFLNAKNEVTPFHVDIVEQDEKVIEEYCIRHPLATCHPDFSAKGQGKRFDVNFVKDSVNDKCIRVEEKTFDDWFRGRLKEAGRKCPYNRIIVCLNGDDKTLGIASKVIEFARRYGVEVGQDVVFARVRDPARNRYLPKGKICSIFSRKKVEDYKERITLFGDLKDIYSFASINVEVVDTMAKVLNGRYGDYGHELPTPAEREIKWEDASFIDQLSSRAAAQGQRNILLLLGMDYSTAPKKVGGAADGQVMVREKLKALRAEKNPVLMTLAINEHMRWNAFHLMMGYRPWQVVGRSDDARDDIPKPWPSKFKANQLDTVGKHADIVPFDELPKVDMQFAEWNTGRKPDESEYHKFQGLNTCSSQAWDIAFCQIVGDVAAAAGLEIVMAAEKGNGSN